MNVHFVFEKRAKALRKENDFVYHERVTSVEQLPEVKGVSLVKPLAIDFANDPELTNSPDIFVRLVSMRAHELSSLYSEEKAKLLRPLTNQAEEKNKQLEQFMSSLGIGERASLGDSASAHDHMKLPKQLLECCASLSLRPTLAREQLPALMRQIVDVSIETKSKLDDILEAIENEDKEQLNDAPDASSPLSSSSFDENSASSEDDEKKHSAPSTSHKAQLRHLFNRYDMLLKRHTAASESNAALHAAFNATMKSLSLLALPVGELSAALPLVEREAHAEAESKQVHGRLVALLAKVDEMRSQRVELLARFQRALLDDDLTRVIASSQNEIGTETSDFFQQHLAKHQQLATYLQQNLAAQDNILRALADANAAYALDRKRAMEASAERDSFIAALIGDYESVGELIAKAEKGREFFAGLQAPLDALLANLTDFCASAKRTRDAKRQQLRPQRQPQPQQLPTSNASFSNGQGLATPSMTMHQPMLSLPTFRPGVGGSGGGGNSTAAARAMLDASVEADSVGGARSVERPKLKDFLPFMKPQSWGNAASNGSGAPARQRLPPSLDKSSSLSAPMPSPAPVQFQPPTQQLQQPIQFNPVATQHQQNQQHQRQFQMSPTPAFNPNDQHQLNFMMMQHQQQLPPPPLQPPTQQQPIQFNPVQCDATQQQRQFQIPSFNPNNQQQLHFLMIKQQQHQQQHDQYLFEQQQLNLKKHRNLVEQQKQQEKENELQNQQLLQQLHQQQQQLRVQQQQEIQLMIQKQQQEQQLFQAQHDKYCFEPQQQSNQLFSPAAALHPAEEVLKFKPYNSVSVKISPNEFDLI